MAKSNETTAGNGKNESRVILACAVLGLLGLAWPGFLGRLYVTDDLAWMFLPFRQFYAECLRQGDSLLWNPNIFNGLPFLTDSNPLTMLLYRFLPFTLACWVELLAMYPVMFAGAYLFLRRLVDDRPAALLGALAFTFSGQNLLRFIHASIIFVVAIIPWKLWLIEKCLRPGSAEREQRFAGQAPLLLALCAGMQLLGGHPQYFWYSVILELVAALGLRPRSAAGWRRFGWLAAAELLGVMLAAVQLLPLYAEMRASVRGPAGSDFALSWSLPPANLVQLWAPYAHAGRVALDDFGNRHEYGIYNGVIVLLLGLWLALRCRGEDIGAGTRRLVVVGFGLFLAGIVLALGRYGGVQWLVAKLPVIGKFRCPCRQILFAHAGMALLVAVSWSLLRRPDRGVAATQNWRWLWLLPAMGLLTAPALRLAGFQVQGGWPVLAPALLAAVAILLLRSFSRGAAWAGALLVPLLTLDLVWYGAGNLLHQQPLTLEQLRGFIASTCVPKALPGKIAVAENLPGMLGWKTTFGYMAMAPRRQLYSYRQDNETPDFDLAYLHVSGTEWLRSSDFGLAAEFGPWARNTKAMPRARLVGGYRLAPAVELRRLLNEIDLGTTVLLTEAPAEKAFAPGPGVVTMLDDRPGWLRLDVASVTPQILVLTESHHPGWRAAVDGRPVPVLAAYGDFLGVALPPGSHRVEFSFRPASVSWGQGISLGAAFVACGWFIILRRQSKALPAGVAATG